MQKYTVLSPFKDADGIHKVGDSVMLADTDAAELLGLGAIVADAPAGPVIPTDAAVRQAAIIGAIGKLDPANNDLWLKDGRPDAIAIAEITGWPVTAAERNAAWAAIIPAA